MGKYLKHILDNNYNKSKKIIKGIKFIRERVY